jgi:hypothetical protein
MRVSEEPVCRKDYTETLFYIGQTDLLVHTVQHVNFVRTHHLFFVVNYSSAQRIVSALLEIIGS